jgi:UDP-N-acetylglucosamine--N-acetylmuramyl-(pentapeptide) pyrophosphoryl-undecaprenol N-acetylglucosamine transferase
MRKLAPQAAIQFVGSASGLENDLITSEGVVFDARDTVQAGPLHGVNPLRALVSLGRLLAGTFQAALIFRRRKPDVVFLTGGWVGVPVALAAWMFRKPIVIFVPDIEPGLTLKVLGRFATAITATTADTRHYFPRKKLVETNYPLRGDLMAANRADGMKRFGLQDDRITLLVFGGSRGARSINRALLAIVENLLDDLDLQIIHVTGGLDWDEVRAAHANLPAAVAGYYHIFEYLHDIGLAMAASDLVVSRAGASTLGEFPYFHLPAILIPYPHAWRYQRVNAEWLESRGAALCLDDDSLPTTLEPTLRELIRDAAKRQSMSSAAQALASDQGAENIARVILEEINS